MSTYGDSIRFTIFGESHGPAIGVTVDGLPSGEAIDLDELQAFLDRRAPGKSALATARKESDKLHILSGLYEGKTCGTPLCAVIVNGDMHSSDYSSLAFTPRPGHADYPAFLRYNGANDIRGGGHFSGRLTAPLCIAGGIAMQILKRKGINVGAHIVRMGGVSEVPFPDDVTPDLLQSVKTKTLPVLDDKAGEAMSDAVKKAASDGDSAGGIIECVILGVEAGIGDTMFESWESRLSAMLFGIPAVKGVEFGDGFSMADKRGSECNDAYRMKDGRITCETNHNGGILGGISSGMPIVFRAAIKPTPSIAREQNTVNLNTKEETTMKIQGRHDPCIVPRAVPVIEAAAALTALDILMISEGRKWN